MHERTMPRRVIPHKQPGTDSLGSCSRLHGLSSGSPGFTEATKSGIQSMSPGPWWQGQGPLCGGGGGGGGDEVPAPVKPAEAPLPGGGGGGKRDEVLVPAKPAEAPLPGGGGGGGGAGPWCTR